MLPHKCSDTGENGSSASLLHKPASTQDGVVLYSLQYEEEKRREAKKLVACKAERKEFLSYEAKPQQYVTYNTTGNQADKCGQRMCIRKDTKSIAVHSALHYSLQSTLCTLCISVCNAANKYMY